MNSFAFILPTQRGAHSSVCICHHLCPCDDDERPCSQLVRGMRDTLPGTHLKFRRILDVAAARSARYGFDEVSTPVIEQTELFCRAIGAETDVVSKEMYTFPDGGKGNTVTLRPEGTAGVLRAVRVSCTLHECRPPSMPMAPAHPLTARLPRPVVV